MNNLFDRETSPGTGVFLHRGIPLCIGMLCLVFPSLLFAASASLYLSPITGTYTTGEPITVKVMVGTGGDSANAVEGVLRYDPMNVEVVSIDRSGSLLSSWTHEPSFDNGKGEISFAGSMSGTSSFSGTRGEIISLTIRGLRSEETRFEFDSGSASSVHAADGTGGNLLSALTSGVYVFSPKENSPELQSPQVSTPTVEPATTTLSRGEVLGVSTGTPMLTSSTHPDEGVWYNIATSSIAWEMPEGVSRVRLSLDKKPTGEGVVAYNAPKNSKEISDISDGVWYVHLTREWGDGHTDSTNYRLAIDTGIPTDVTITEQPRKNTTDAQGIFTLTGTDTLSGIDHYEIAIDGGSPTTWVDDGAHLYRAGALSPGTHTVTATAIDRAGNRAGATTQLTIEHLPTPLLALSDKKSFKEGDPLLLALSSIPNATLFIAISRDGGTPVTEEYTLDATGGGTYTSALVTTPGVYRISATAKMQNGATSLESEAIEITVGSSFMGILKRNPLIPFVSIALVLLIAGSWFFWKRFSGQDYDQDEEEGEDDEEDEIQIAQTTSRVSPIASGALVLGQARKSGSSVRPTRL